MINLSVILLSISILITAWLFFYILSAGKHRTYTANLILIATGFVLFWDLCLIVEYIMWYLGDPGHMFVEMITYVGATIVPVFILLIGIAFTNAKTKASRWEWLLFIVPVVTVVIALTNDYTHLFYIDYVFYPTAPYVVLGPYFYFYGTYTYLCMTVGIVYMFVFVRRNRGNLIAKQVVLVLMGCVVPVVVSFLYTIGVQGFNMFATPTAMSFTMLCISLAVLKFDLMKIAPIALKTIVDRISDSYVAIDDGLYIVDFNQSFKDNFFPILPMKVGDRVQELAKNVDDFLGIPVDLLMETLAKMPNEPQTITREVFVNINDEVRYYDLEVTPVYTGRRYAGVVALFVDITQRKRDLEIIKENQEIMLERERLASLGQMVGGISHNLKTPILSLSGGLVQIEDLIREYDSSIGDKEVTDEDHKEIVADMLEVTEKLKSYLSYMSDIITAVKGQATQLNTTSGGTFTVRELIGRVDILMRYELIQKNCELVKEINVNTRAPIQGEINSLVQVFDNIIVNAIQAYKGKPGKIILTVDGDDKNILFTFGDFAGGISQKIRESLFKQMITTKGKDGTGIGLYMCYSTVKGMFRGDMWFESEENNGTKFFVSIPIADEASSKNTIGGNSNAQE